MAQHSTKNTLSYGQKTGGNALKALIAAQYTGVDVDYNEIKIGVDTKTPEFLAKNPNGMAPVLETPHGPIWESNACARYLAREGKNNLYGKDNYEAALVEQWIEWSTNELALPGRAWLMPIWVPTIPNNPKATARAKEDLKKALGILNDHLLHRTFVVGERVSLADIILFATLTGAYATVFDPHFRKPFANVNRWFMTIANQPEVKKVLPEVKLADKMAVAPAHQPAAAAEPKGEKKQEKKPAQEKKEEKKPAQEKKPKAPAADEEDDDDGIPRDEEPKGKNPLDLLPKSETFQMDDWKRTYSNSKDYKGFVAPWFWEHFDPKGYSIYSCVYKNNEDLDAEYKTANRIGGWFQRLDKVRKYAFGNVLYHKTGDSKFYISGLWVFRGADLPQDLKENDDAEHYTWTKEDPADPELKKRFLEYACWEGDFAGKGDALGGKTFK